MDINWNNFKFIMKYKQIEEVYVDGIYMDIEKLHRHPIWDKYHNLLYWLSRDNTGIFLKYKTMDNIKYEEIRQWFKSIIK
ncbi:MAG: hypothetical protein ACYDG2_26685 [Ruminiclostridium sp.]